MAAIRAFGAEVLEQGRDFDEAREWVEDFAAREGWRYVHNANEPHLIAGVATYAAEVFEAVERVDFVFVPIGGGSGAAGCAVVREGLGTKTRIVGVQAREADAFARSWRGPARVTSERADDVRGRDRDANDLRPHVLDAEDRIGRCGDSRGSGTSRRSCRRHSVHSQPRRRCGRRAVGRGATIQASSERDSCVRHVWRKRGHAHTSSHSCLTARNRSG